MRRFMTLGILTMSLFGCLFGRSPSLEPTASLPAGASFVVFDDGDGLVAVDPVGGKAYRWTPRQATQGDLAGMKPVLLGHRLLSRPGLQFDLPVPANGRDPSVSPDLTRFAFAKPGEEMASTVSVVTLSDSTEAPLTSGGGEPAWLPDNTIGLRGGNQLSGTEIYRVDPDGSNLVKVVDGKGQAIAYTEWSPNGLEVAYSINTSSARRVDVARADASGSRAVIDVADAQAIRPRWSPDGKYVAAMVRLPADSKLMAPHTLWVVDVSTGKGKAILDLPAAAPSVLKRGAYTGVREFAWSPDSSSIAFFAAMSGDCSKNTSGELLCRHDVYVVNRDGSDMKKVLAVQSRKSRRLAWLP